MSLKSECQKRVGNEYSPIKNSSSKKQSFNSNRGNQTSNWVGDKLFEETSMTYLGSTRIFEDLKISDIVKDRKRQLQGIDIIGEWNNEKVNIDVKSIASQLGTFCFEISGNVSSGQVGWLLNDNLETDYYLIVYHDVEGAPNNYRLGKRIMNIANVNETEALLINKETLKNCIEDELKKPLEEIVSDIRNKDYGERKGIVRFNKNCEEMKGSVKEIIYPTLSLGLKEQPINVVVKKSVLLEIAEKHWII